jgi:pimeloyl-ACP methyl ester carboxylesterase
MAHPDGRARLGAARPTAADAAAVPRLIGPDGRGPADRDAVAARLTAMRAQGGDAYAALFPPPRERHLDDLTLGRDELAAVRARVLLVHGGRDRIVPLRDALPLLDALPDADLLVLGRCGHSPHAEQPDTVHRLLADHLEHDA